jgi:hypothetical protein
VRDPVPPQGRAVEIRTWVFSLSGRYVTRNTSPESLVVTKKRERPSQGRHGHHGERPGFSRLNQDMGRNPNSRPACSNVSARSRRVMPGAKRPFAYRVQRRSPVWCPGRQISRAPGISREPAESLVDAQSMLSTES